MRKKLSVFVMALAGAVLLAGCGSNTTTATDTATETTAEVTTETTTEAAPALQKQKHLHRQLRITEPYLPMDLLPWRR